MWILIKIIIGIYVGIALLIYLKQSRYVYAPRRKVLNSPVDLGLDFENVSIKSQDGVQIAGWYIPVKTGRKARHALIYCHGNAGNIGDRLPVIKTFSDMGFDLLIFDYRGYGNSMGLLSENGTYMDALSAWNYMKVKGYSAGNIIIFGSSLGGAIAAWLAEQVKPGMLVMESSFTSAVDMAAKMFPFMPAKLICKYKYDAASIMSRIKCPVIVAHSVDDETVPFFHGMRLFERAHEPKKFIEMKGLHNFTGIDVDSNFQKVLKEFVDEKMPVESE